MHLLFDLDGTLTDSGLGILRCAQYALGHFGIQVDDLDALRPFVGPPLEDSFIQFYGFTPEQADEAVRVYRERYFSIGVYENEVYPGTHEALAELCRRGHQLHIASSKNLPMVHEVLRYFDLAQYFTFIGARDEAGTRHTKADVLRHVLTDGLGYTLDADGRLSTTPSTTPPSPAPAPTQTPTHAPHRGATGGLTGSHPLMIGDRFYDVEGAHEVGLPAMGILWGGYGTRQEFVDCGAEYIVNTWDELLECLQVKHAH